MQAKEGVIDLLNQMLTIELTAINQYFLASKICANWGFSRLEAAFRGFSMSEMKDTDSLVSHILYLEGLPNLQRLNQIRIGQTVEEMLRAGQASEVAAIEFLRGAIAHCASVSDFTTRAMFERMIEDEEQHLDWFETQFDTIARVGLEQYLAQQIYN